MNANNISCNQIQYGFTLVELMIVITVIGILAAIALPAYQDNVVRVRAAEALVASSGVKTIVIENISNNGGNIPADACIGFTDVGIATNNVASITCIPSTGVVEVITTVKAGSTTFTLTPNATANAVSWKCSADISKYAPAGCR